MEIKWRSEFYGWKKTSQLNPSFSKLFNLNEYLALNKGFQLVKYCPDTIAANEPTIATNLLDVFPKILLINIPKPSIYRPFAQRILYSSYFGTLHELDGQGKPISEMMRYLSHTDCFSTFNPRKDVWELNNKKVSTWSSDKLYKYMLFYFDNVEGPHGRYEIINLHSKGTSATEQFISRINASYNSISDGEQKINDVRTDFINLHKRFNIKFSEHYKKAIITALDNFFVAQAKKGQRFLKKKSKYLGFPIAFREGLFTFDVTCSLSMKSFGTISIENEKLHTLRPYLLDGKLAFDIVPIIRKNEELEDEILVNFPYFGSKY